MEKINTDHNARFSLTYRPLNANWKRLNLVEWFKRKNLSTKLSLNQFEMVHHNQVNKRNNTVLWCYKQTSWLRTKTARSLSFVQKSLGKNAKRKITHARGRSCACESDMQSGKPPAVLACHMRSHTCARLGNWQHCSPNFGNLKSQNRVHKESFN